MKVSLRFAALVNCPLHILLHKVTIEKVELISYSEILKGINGP